MKTFKTPALKFQDSLHKRHRQLKGLTTDDEEEPWPDVGSILDSTGSMSKPMSYRSKCGSANSSSIAVRRNEAAAEAAASQEILAGLEEQEREETELQMLQAEDKQRLAIFEAKNLARQQTMEDKRRKLNRLEEVKRLNAAKARVKVYDQPEENVEVVNMLYEVKPNTTQPFHTSSPSCIPKPLSVPTQALNAASSPFISQPPTVTIQNQASPTSTSMPHAQNSSDWINVLAETISANRLPTPEPAVFT